MQPDNSQYPLLQEVSEFFRGESAVAKRDLSPPEELGEDMRALSASLELEFLAEVGALVYPERVLLGMREVHWFPRGAPLPLAPRLVGRARREGSGGEVVVTLSVEPASAGAGASLDEVETPIPVCRALLQFGHVYPPAPWSQQRMMDPRAEHLHNGAQLYEAAGVLGQHVPAALQVVSWARQCELGRLQGGLVHPRQMARALPSSRFQVAPAALEGSLHLVQWLWYAFSGEGSRVMTLSEATWYRMPRRDERLRCDVQLRGTSAGLASFDALLHGQDGIPLLELRGIGAASQPAEEPSPTLPRVAWQSFIKSLTPR